MLEEKLPVRKSLVKSSLGPAVVAIVLLLGTGLGALVLAGGAGAPPRAGLAAQPPAGPARVAETATAVAPNIPFAPPVAPPAGSVTATATVTATTVATDPFALLNIFDFVPEDGALVSESILNVGGDATNEVLLTANVTRPQTTTLGTTITPTVGALAVLRYDATNSRWHVQWETGAASVPGAATELPDTFPGSSRRYQAGDLLRTGQPILLLRTVDPPAPPRLLPAVHLRLWAWTGDAAVPVQMAGPDGNPGPADFVGSSDVQLADLDDDGVMEVIVDSGAHTTVYRWDKDRFVVRP